MVKMKQHIYQAPDPKVRVAYTVLKAYAIAQRCPPSQRAVAYVLAHENAQPKPVGCNLTKLRTRRKKIVCRVCTDRLELKRAIQTLTACGVSYPVVTWCLLAQALRLSALDSKHSSFNTGSWIPEFALYYGLLVLRITFCDPMEQSKSNP